MSLYYIKYYTQRNDAWGRGYYIELELTDAQLDNLRAFFRLCGLDVTIEKIQ